MSSAGADYEVADVRERDHVLVPITEAIRGYEQHHGLWGASSRGHDGEGRAEQDEGRGGSEGHGEEE